MSKSWGPHDIGGQEGGPVDLMTAIGESGHAHNVYKGESSDSPFSLHSQCVV